MHKIFRSLSAAAAVLLLTASMAHAASAEEGPVLVTGATGQTGRLLVSTLLAQGRSVRALARSPDKAELDDAVEVVKGDATDPASLGPAFAGVSVVISTIGARFPFGSNGFAAVDWEGNRALIDAAKAAGVSQFILLSAGSAGRDGFPFSLPIAPYPWKAKSEAYLRQSGMPYTIIAAGGLRDEPANQSGMLLSSRADYVSDLVNRGDLAEVLAASIGNAEALGKTIAVVNSEQQAVDAWRKAFSALPAD